MSLKAQSFIRSATLKTFPSSGAYICLKPG